MNTKKKRSLSFNLILFLLWVVIFAAISIKEPNFLKANYIISTMLRNIVEIGMIALPMTLIIITGGIDLSVGNLLILSAIFGGSAAASWGTPAGVLVTFAVGLVGGLINGLIIAKAKISDMVTTLATMYLFLGLARGFSEGQSVYTYSVPTWMGNTIFLGLPVQIWFLVVLAVAFVILLEHTPFGRRLYAIGQNRNASKFSGIDVEKMQVLIYVICGLVCAFASLIYLGRFTSVKYDSGANMNLKVITIVVLGGTSIAGGFGDMKGTLIATLIISTLNSGLTVLNIPIAVQVVVQGLVLLIALVAFSVMNISRDKKKAKRVRETQTE